MKSVCRVCLGVFLVLLLLFVLAPATVVDTISQDVSVGSAIAELPVPPPLPPPPPPPPRVMAS